MTLEVLLICMQLFGDIPPDFNDHTISMLFVRMDASKFFLCGFGILVSAEQTKGIQVLRVHRFFERSAAADDDTDLRLFMNQIISAEGKAAVLRNIMAWLRLGFNNDGQVLMPGAGAVDLAVLHRQMLKQVGVKGNKLIDMKRCRRVFRALRDAHASTAAVVQELAVLICGGLCNGRCS